VAVREQEYTEDHIKKSEPKSNTRLTPLQSPAESFCTLCQVHLCAPCKAATHSAKVFQTHKLDSLAEGSTSLAVTLCGLFGTWEGLSRSEPCRHTYKAARHLLPQRRCAALCPVLYGAAAPLACQGLPAHRRGESDPPLTAGGAEHGLLRLANSICLP
jgi:hypothetical protein